MIDPGSFKEFMDLHIEKKRLENKLKDIKYEINQKEPFLIEVLQSNDMTKISMNGKTCYTRVNTFATITDKQAAIAILKANGYEDYVEEKYNAQSISKLVRDLLEDNDGQLPEEFGDVIKVGRSAKLNVINS